MVDFLKLYTRDQGTMESLWENPLLRWSSRHEWAKGIQGQTVVKEYKGTQFAFGGQGLRIRLRPHYLFNNGRHNANDFSASDCITVLSSFVEELGLDPSRLVVQNLEFGVNVLSPIDATQVIDWTKFHGRNEFVKEKGLRFAKVSYTSDSHGRASSYKQIKFYAKGLQLPQFCDRNTLRFEIRSKQAKYIQKLGVYTLEDLLQPLPYERFRATLLEEFEEVLILERGLELDGRNKANMKLKSYLNEYNWYRYRSGAKNTFRKNFNRYKSLLQGFENSVFINLWHQIANKR